MSHVLLWRDEHFLRSAGWRRWRKPVGLQMGLSGVADRSVLLEPAWLPYAKSKAAGRWYSFDDIGLGIRTELYPYSKYYLSYCPCSYCLGRS
ncbi:hypothetical protein ACIA6C_29725 [Streptomyces sp. NPDC051578]|uniref:hypothetical protein n=1 Tax=Streptomyces sp. NPDC051578 TaxID=3365662 RepID=UPI00378CC942